MKFSMTPELAKLVKTLRVQSGISSKDLAEHIERSPSYVSKLEGGDVRTIRRDLLADILCFTAGSDDFYGEALPRAVSILQSTMARGRLVDQMWLMHYDVVERPVSVSFEMAKDIVANLDEADVSIDDLIGMLNANIDSQMSPSFPANEMIAVDYGGSRRMLARVELTKTAVERVLRGGIETTYFVFYNIVYTMFRMRCHPGAATKLPPDDAAGILRQTAAYMQRWNVHSLIGYSRFLSSDEFIEYQRPLAVSETGVVERIGEQLKEIVSHDSLHAINQLNSFSDTLGWDPAFALKIVGIPFSSLGDLSFSNKRALLEDIQELVDRYDRMDDFKRKIESY